MVLTPVTPTEQRLQALAAANETRIKRGRVKARLAEGDRKAFQSVMLADPIPKWMGGERLVTVLQSLPRVGRQRAYQLIEDHRLPADVRMREIRPQVRLAIFDRVIADYKYAFRKKSNNH